MLSTKNKSRTILISGLSGSGKSLAAKALEDIGFYCVDNLPTPLIESFFKLSNFNSIPNIAMVIDARDAQHIQNLPVEISKLRKGGRDLQVLFFDASDEVLVRRFSETRHRHPLSPQGSVEKGIQAERTLLAEIKELSDQVINTSRWTSHELREFMFKAFDDTKEGQKLVVNLLSFGFRYGVPLNADLMFDVRFLKNPYFEPELRYKTGVEHEIKEYVLKQEDARQFLDQIQNMLSFLLPRYQKESKSYLTLAIGCTGGKHRSVVVAGELEELLKKQGFDVTAVHRDRLLK